ncbi:hypothetical protein [Streptomyces stelliscabiei]|uniref:hypothetical protein n=1 Tax=Streptomyces stelliscabiei TaxID=146820 RepID=UPI0029BEBB0B|nr:hypothetical protein [Streptomyces stelliscabiei]MDX3435673.1 hypothetical protein [Streptomyces stelliscabiei]MDX3622028.1 hypothetical protein [Streptomyces stelliscabiei]
MDFTGPLPIEAPTDYSDLIRSTAAERGRALLAYTLRWVGEDGTKIDGTGNIIAPGWADAPDGWATFNASRAPELAGDICADLFMYVKEAAGAEGLRRTLRQLLGPLAEELEATEDEDQRQTLQHLLASLADVIG